MNISQEEFIIIELALIILIQLMLGVGIYMLGSKED